MTVSRELLWQAYPDLLVMRGVSTVGGWTCTHAGTGTDFVQWDRPPLPWGDPGAWVLRWTGAVWLGMDAEHFHARGDLLPNLDPEADPATWACALHDLAAAVSADCPNAGYFLYRDTDGEWALASRWQREENHEALAFFDLDTDDPAEALCLARASLRKKE